MKVYGDENELFYGLFAGLGSLLTGMKVTLREFFTRKTTECYPENRSALKMYERFRGTLELVHNERNEHRCVACGICEMNCPNGTIHVHADVVEDENGKKKKVLREYEYDLGELYFLPVVCGELSPPGVAFFYGVRACCLYPGETGA